MNDNDLLREIHHVRERLARVCDCDVHKIGERMRLKQREEMARGVRYVSFIKPRVTGSESCVVREEPPMA
jgi:hypothetical protein